MTQVLKTGISSDHWLLETYLLVHFDCLVDCVVLVHKWLIEWSSD